MTNLDSILKSIDVTLPTKVCLIKAMVFPVVMYGCGSWTIKKAECQRIDAFELWCWRRHLESPLDCRGPHHFLSPLAVVSLLPTPGVCTAQQGQQGALLALAGGQLQESGVSASQAQGILLSSPCHLPALWAERPAVLWAVEIRNTGGGTGLRVLCGN